MSYSRISAKNLSKISLFLFSPFHQQIDLFLLESSLRFLSLLIKVTNTLSAHILLLTFLDSVANATLSDIVSVISHYIFINFLLIFSTLIHFLIGFMESPPDALDHLFVV